MSHFELLSSIENLRLRLHSLVSRGFAYPEVLEVSRELDKLIVEYYQIAARTHYREDGRQLPCHFKKKVLRERLTCHYYDEIISL
ncbi:MAG: Spo0E like sporulation regulatory protein [Firmicutes bacterium ADurb.Bin456]|nr:MAG: Spo0E like sporulation regulatory protein [Firmicutes bacterium ADurb.Bin456]